MSSAGAPPGRRRARHAKGWILGWALVVWPAWAAVAGPEAPDPGATSPRAGFGAPGVVWGRLAVEEESPDGPLTPLAGVEVTLYPSQPALEQALEQIRARARTSHEAYVAAPGAVLERLEAHRAQTAAVGGAGGLPQRVTDGRGLFVFDAVPAGAWLLVAVQRTPYGPPAEGMAQRRRPADPRFVPRAGARAVQEADIWIVRVQVRPGERTRVLLTDRGRWLTGPLR